MLSYAGYTSKRKSSKIGSFLSNISLNAGGRRCRASLAAGCSAGDNGSALALPFPAPTGIFDLTGATVLATPVGLVERVNRAVAGVVDLTAAVAAIVLRSGIRRAEVVPDFRRTAIAGVLVGLRFAMLLPAVALVGTRAVAIGSGTRRVICVRTGTGAFFGIDVAGIFSRASVGPADLSDSESESERKGNGSSAKRC